MSVVTGEVRLLQAALKDPAVGRFILASESNIPIRSVGLQHARKTVQEGGLVHLQLQHARARQQAAAAA